MKSNICIYKYLLETRLAIYKAIHLSKSMSIKETKVPPKEIKIKKEESQERDKILAKMPKSKHKSITDINYEKAQIIVEGLTKRKNPKKTEDVKKMKTNTKHNINQDDNEKVFNELELQEKKADEDKKIVVPMKKIINCNLNINESMLNSKRSNTKEIVKDVKSVPVINSNIEEKLKNIDTSKKKKTGGKKKKTIGVNVK